MHLHRNLLAGIERGARAVFVATGSGRYIGMSIADAAAYEGEEVGDFAIRVLDEERPHPLMVYHLPGTADDHRRMAERTFRHPRMMVASDGIYHGQSGHPRGYGCFARALRLARETGAVTIETAIHKMSGFPAERFRIKGRGLLAADHAADVVIFDPERRRRPRHLGRAPARTGRHRPGARQRRDCRPRRQAKQRSTRPRADVERCGDVAMSIPALTAKQMAEVDRIMLEEFGVETMQLMEVAGRAVAVFARQCFLAGDARGKRVVVLCGSGGNGGDGMVAARYLHAWGAFPEIWLGRRPVPGKGIAAHQLAILERLGIPIRESMPSPSLPAAELLIDALLGFSLAGPPEGETAALIVAANAHPAAILAVDLPSGLEATSGKVHDLCVRADATLTLALPKTGLLVPSAREVVGELAVADIGVPPAAYARIGVQVEPVFATADVVWIDRRL